MRETNGSGGASHHADGAPAPPRAPPPPPPLLPSPQFFICLLSFPFPCLSSRPSALLPSPLSITRYWNVGSIINFAAGQLLSSPIRHKGRWGMKWTHASGVLCEVTWVVTYNTFVFVCGSIGMGINSGVFGLFVMCWCVWWPCRIFVYTTCNFNS